MRRDSEATDDDDDGRHVWVRRLLVDVLLSLTFVVL